MNSATKISTLLIVTISLLCSVEALRCFKCGSILFPKICKTTENYCEAKYGEKCLLATYGNKDGEVNGLQTCTNKCFINFTLPIMSAKFHVSCCDSNSFCNKP